jgi:hypothetical protein
VGARLQHIAITGIGGGTSMTNKLSLGLAPLLVIAAFVMTPASALGAAEITWPSCTAPACPHVYKNGTMGPEGEPVQEISWGNSQFHNTKLGEVECHNIYAGFAVNPTGGGRAEGKVQAFFPYECTDETCTVLSLGEIKVTNGKTLPWKAEVMENAAKEFFRKTGFKGPTENKKANPATEPGQVDFNVNCTMIGAADFFGVQYYKILNNGVSIGAAPAGETLQAEGATGRSLESENNAFGPLEPKSSLRVEGFGAQELIEVKNP